MDSYRRGRFIIVINAYEVKIMAQSPTLNTAPHKWWTDYKIQVETSPDPAAVVESHNNWIRENYAPQEMEAILDLPDVEHVIWALTAGVLPEQAPHWYRLWAIKDLNSYLQSAVDFISSNLDLPNIQERKTFLVEQLLILWPGGEWLALGDLPKVINFFAFVYPEAADPALYDYWLGADPESFFTAALQTIAAKPTQEDQQVSINIFKAVVNRSPVKATILNKIKPETAAAVVSTFFPEQLTTSLAAFGRGAPGMGMGLAVGGIILVVLLMNMGRRRQPQAAVAK